MASKTILFALFAVFSLQCFTQAKHIHVSEHSSILEDLKKFAEQLKQTAQDLNEESIAELKEAFEKLVDSIREEVEKHEEGIQQLAYSTTTEIALLKRTAEYVTIDLTECFTVHEELIQKLTQNALGNVRECFSKVVEEFTVMYNKTLQTAQESYDKIFVLVGELFECKDVPCGLNVWKKLFAEMMEVNNRVRFIIDDGVRAMQRALPEAIACMREGQSQYKEEIQALVADIKGCIRNKISEAQ